MAGFNYIQTFYVNPDAVANAPEVMLTSIDVYFKSKPQLDLSENCPATFTNKFGSCSSSPMKKLRGRTVSVGIVR